MLKVNRLFISLIILSFVALSSALKCDDRYSKADAYFELKEIENFYKFSASVYIGMFNFE